MNISEKDFNNYIAKLRKLSSEASQKIDAYIAKNGLDDKKALIDYMYALVTKYGEGSATLAADMYDAISVLQKANVAEAVIADVASYGETAKAVYGSLIQSPDGRKISQVADRLVKQASADTMIQNAKRDKAEWAWIPEGVTCAFCLMLASQGWMPASAAQMRGYHADHIHANCDCQFMIRHNSDFNVAGYNPQRYKMMYENADTESYENENTSHPQGKQTQSDKQLNALRRELYQDEKDEINENKRMRYEERKKEAE